ALLRIIEAQQQLQHRTFAGSGRADERHALARAYMQVKLCQGVGFGARGVAEADSIEVDAPRPGGSSYRLLRIMDAAARSQQLPEALGGARSALHISPDFT